MVFPISETKLGNVVVQPAFTISVTGDGQVIDGLVLSTLFTLNWHEVVKPLASVAVKVTTVVPTPLTAEPIAGDCVTVTVPQLSAAMANPV